MRRIVILMVLVLAFQVSGAAGQELDLFGMWTDGNDGWVNYKMVIQYQPFNLYIVLHSPCAPSTCGYNVSFDLPDFTIQVLDIHGGINHGGDFNHIVEYPTPVPIAGDLFVCATIHGIFLQPFSEIYLVEMGPADPNPIPDHDGPSYMKEENPDAHIPCGYITGCPHVFSFNLDIEPLTPADPEPMITPDRLRATPNPFNPVTTLSFDSALAGDVVIRIFDLQGRQIDDLACGYRAAGRHEVTWQARDRQGRELPSGVYCAVMLRDGRRSGDITKLSLVR